MQHTSGPPIVARVILVALKVLAGSDNAVKEEDKGEGHERGWDAVGNGDLGDHLENTDRQKVLALEEERTQWSGG